MSTQFNPVDAARAVSSYEARMPVPEDEIVHGMNDLRDHIFALNDRWWRDPATGAWIENPNKGEKIALIHSEISEALEGARKGLMDDHLPHRRAEEVEMADAVIRILDYCGRFGLDIGGAVAEKLRYNQTRKDHTTEARLAAGGKKF